MSKSFLLVVTTLINIVILNAQNQVKKDIPSSLRTKLNKGTQTIGLPLVPRKNNTEYLIYGFEIPDFWRNQPVNLNTFKINLSPNPFYSSFILYYPEDIQDYSLRLLTLDGKNIPFITETIENKIIVEITSEYQGLLLVYFRINGNNFFKKAISN